MADTMRTTTAAPIRGTTAPAASGDNGQERSGAGPVADVKEIGSEMASAVRDSATTLFEEQRNRAADEIAALGEALRRSAESFEGGGTVARYAGDAARQIGDFATTLRGRSWNDMVGDVEDFARRWPMAFMAAAVGIGFAAGRFLMASGGRPSGSQQSGGMQSGGNRLPVTTSTPGAAGTTGTASGAISGYGAGAARENR